MGILVAGATEDARAASDLSVPLKVLPAGRPKVCAWSSPPCLGGGGDENVDYNFHSPADTNASIVGSHFWVRICSYLVQGKPRIPLLITAGHGHWQL